MQNSKNKSQTLTIKDKIYGKFKIDSPVIITLIKSEPLQRLKRISQMGVPSEFYYRKTYSRYEHSIGVYLLLKRLNASLEEQIAGLLHDISHTAFSHVVDWVLGDGKTEEFQNEKHADFLLNSEASKILKKYGYNPKRIAEHRHFTLLEQEIPDLCADRIDYSIREFPQKIVKECLDSMINKNGKIVFKNQKTAFLFAIVFLRRQTIHWAGFESSSRYRLFSNMLRLALDKKIFDFEDFWQDDKFILNKITNVNDSEINKLLDILRNSSLKNLPKGEEIVYKKFRYVDPLFIKNGELLRLSEVNQEFKNELAKAKKINKQGILLSKIN